MMQLSKSHQALLFLIRQELKIRRLFFGFERAGFEECCFQPHLDLLILSEVGLNDGKDETMRWYCNMIERRSRIMKSTRASITRQSLGVYMELIAERERRAKSVHR